MHLTHAVDTSFRIMDFSGRRLHADKCTWVRVQEAQQLEQELMHSIEEHEKQASDRRLPNSASDADRGGGEGI